MISKYIKTIIILSLLSFFVACNKSSQGLLKTYNKSTYFFDTASNKSANDSVKVSFEFNFSDQNTTSNPAQVKVGCNVFKTTENELNIKIGKMDVPVQFIITSIGYFSIETVPIETNDVDTISIIINFVEDDSPLVHCPQFSSIHSIEATDAYTKTFYNGNDICIIH